MCVCVLFFSVCQRLIKQKSYYHQKHYSHSLVRFRIYLALDVRQFSKYSHASSYTNLYVMSGCFEFVFGLIFRYSTFPTFRLRPRSTRELYNIRRNHLTATIRHSFYSSSSIFFFNLTVKNPTVSHRK